eukprot:TRINITY_DN34405_c0_g1_i1.p1 TRINITY_DN34405_c0_g1~~TRINITY_DN34405_c0_g1_i1.p1  ORF type:complete len:207 (-),score=10.15 TRINITY_DN34405_c0_g1_i1:243-782(-)
MLVPASNVVLPPTQFALKMRPVFVVLLVMQGLLMVGRFVILDIWGGMLTMLVVTLGALVVSPAGSMDTTYCMYYGLMCCVNGIFDSILCVERCMYVKYTLFSRAAPVLFNVASAVFILCPTVEVLATITSVCIYMDAQDAESRMLLGPLMRNADGDARGGNGPTADVGFVPFRGRCHHL